MGCIFPAQSGSVGASYPPAPSPFSKPFSYDKWPLIHSLCGSSGTPLQGCLASVSGLSSHGRHKVISKDFFTVLGSPSHILLLTPLIVDCAIGFQLGTLRLYPPKELLNSCLQGSNCAGSLHLSSLHQLVPREPCILKPRQA